MANQPRVVQFASFGSIRTGNHYTLYDNPILSILSYPILSYFARDTSEIHSLFNKYDLEKNGKLDKAELKELLEDDLGLSPEQSCVYVLMIDQAGEHNVTSEEFFNWLRSGERFENINDKSKFGKLCQAMEIFKTYDTDNRDTLDRKQFENLIASLGYHNVNSEKLFKELDIHRCGKLSFWEFMKWLNWVPVDCSSHA